MTPEVWEFSLKTLCPVHIGGGEDNSPISPIEYIRGKVTRGNGEKRDVLFILDPSALAGALVRENILSLSDLLLTPGERRLEDLLKDLGLGGLVSKLARASRRRIDAGNLDPKTNLEIKACIRTAGAPYIPGSSVKGCLRSAVAAAWLAENPGARRQALNASSDLPVFRPRDDKDMHKDLMRAVTVSDAFPDDRETAVYETRQLRRKDNEEVADTPAVVEAIKPGAICPCRWTVDRGLIKRLYGGERPPAAAFFETRGEALKALHRQADKTLNHWLDRFEKLIPQGGIGDEAFVALQDLLKENTPEKPLLYIGAHEGWYGKSVASAFDDDYEDIRKKALNVYSRRGKAAAKSETFPATFRVALDRTGKFGSLLGWCRLEPAG